MTKNAIEALKLQEERRANREKERQGRSGLTLKAIDSTVNAVDKLNPIKWLGGKK